MPICQNLDTDIPHYDLKFYVGDDDSLIMYWKTEHIDPDTGITTKTPVDLTGYTAEMHFRIDYSDKVTIDPIVYNTVEVVYNGEEVAQITSESPIHTETGIIDEPLTGRIEFILTSLELRTLFGDAYSRKTYIYDVQVTNPTSMNRTLMLGSVVLTNDITKTP